MTTEPTYRLGRLPPVVDRRTLQLARYMPEALPPAPVTVRWSNFVTSWPMYGNDAYGDCTIAAVGHFEQIQSSVRRKPITPSAASILARYKRLTGCKKPGDAHDTGLNENTVLRDWRQHGVGNRKMLAWADVNVWDHNAVRNALSIFRGLYIGFGISDPQQLFSEFSAGKPWTPEQGQVTEGHAVNIADCDADTLTCVSWGRLQKMTWAFWDHMVDECHAVLLADETASLPAGFNLPLIRADLALVGTLEA